MNKQPYKPLYKPNQLIYGTGAVVIIAGWTRIEQIAKKLPESTYAAIGQLYSPARSISFLIRNLLANPHIRHVLILDAIREDKAAGASEALACFLSNGVVDGSTADTGVPAWVIPARIPGYIDREIDLKALERLRQNLVWQVCSSLDDLIQTALEWEKKASTDNPWGEAQEFPLHEPLPTIVPGNRYAHVVRAARIADAWVEILHLIKRTGTLRKTGYDCLWQELINLTVVITEEPEGFYFPEPNYLPIRPEDVERYAREHILEDSVCSDSVKYTYAHRMRSHFGRDQIEQVITKLVAEIDAASAVISLWDVRDHDQGGSPCLNHIWIRVVEGELSLTATFRSNDMFAAWPSNAMGLRVLQRHICNEVNQRAGTELSLGPLMTISQSAHIYQDCWDNAQAVIEKHLKLLAKPSYADPCGNFIVEVQQDSLVVIRTARDSGSLVCEYRGKNPLKLMRQICLDAPGIAPEHAAYLGIELQKAAIALSQSISYSQDQPLSISCLSENAIIEN